MKMVKLYSPSGNEILAPEPNVEYLLSKGFREDKPRAKAKKPEPEPQTEEPSQETE